MYRSRATILTPKSFTILSKVCMQAHHLESLKFVTFSRNISTATQMSELDNYSGLKGENYCDFQQNPDGVFNYNSNNTDSWNNNKNFSPIPQNVVYSRNSGRTEQNPSVVYGQTPRTEFQEPTGGATSFFSKDTMGFQQNPRVQDENFSSGSVNVSSRNKSQQTVWQKDSGYRGEHGRHYQQNSYGYYGGNSELSQQNFSGNYTRNAGVPRQDLHQNYNSGNVTSVQGENTGTYPQSASGYNVERYTSSSGYSRGMMGQYQQNVRNFDPSGNGHQVSYQPQNRIVERQDMGTSIAVEQSNDSADSNKMKGSIDELDNFCQEGKLKEAVEVLHMLDQQHITVDLSRYTMLMDVCSEDKSLEEAKSVHEHLVRSYPHLDVKMYNKILEMYGKCGSMKDAFPVFEKMPQRNLASWDTMITWLSKNGHGEDAIELFAEFKKTGMKPDEQMFLGVFHACSVVGDTVEGMLHFESMSKYYNTVPSDEHYVGVVGMLGSTGYLDEAMEFIEKMPVEPSIEVWETMMNLCRIHGDLELGDRCAEIVELLDPSRLDEQLKAGFLAVKASDIAKEKEKKKLSQSLLEARSRVHEYRAGDRSHPDHEKIYELLGGLKQLMKEDGYIPEVKFVLHDVDQETKEDALMAHSERLAFAQGLMSSPARSQIRIIKNLRVCGDCHNALKIASKLVGREIVMRDAKRFHHVKDGLCSCKDYW